MTDKWALIGVAMALAISLICAYAARGMTTEDWERQPVKTTTTATL